MLLLEHPLIEDQEHEQEKELRNAIANSASVDSPTRAIDFCRRENTRQGSSVVEQPRKPSGLVAKKNSLGLRTE